MQPFSFLGSSPRVKKTVGIDLGTTNSVIALLDPTDSLILTGRDEQGRMTFPSLVGYHPDWKRLVVGRSAQALPAVGAASAVPLTLPLSSVKRFMGLDRRFAVGSLTLSPPEASACVLRHLRDVLGATLAQRRYLLDSAIITMPAYFNHNQIEATRQAGELAGFEVVELLHEPTAAAIYYAWVENHQDATYLVYDLGGGTFDVSIIRRRLGDCEVLAVSGDPFLGGDDFDRLLASHLLEAGRWTTSSAERPDDSEVGDVSTLFDPATPTGAVRFARLVQVAEGVKVALTDAERVERLVPGAVRDDGGRLLSVEVTVERSLFTRLIKDKVDRTIECCYEALGRARERAGVRLSDIDYVILVGGSSRVPLVRDTVRAAFCNPALAEHVRQPDPLLHEPDLCVAYGAALRAATHGTRFVFAMGAVPDKETSRQADKEKDTTPVLELHVTSPPRTNEVNYQVTGIVRVACGSGSVSPCLPVSLSGLLEGGSVRIHCLATGLTEEAFLDDRGAFVQDVELQPQTDNVLELTVCDGDGQELARAETTVRHQATARTLGEGVLPTQIITKPLSIEVLGRDRQRVKQVVAPVGATLPGVFRCTCRTHDQAGRVVVPIFEENRIVKQMVLDDLDRSLPVGSPVEVELAIDVKHMIRVQVRVAPGQGERMETATIEAPPPSGRPSREEVDALQERLDELLAEVTGSLRTRVRARAARVRDDLLEALRYNDEPRAIQRLAELRELVADLETGRGQALEPPWTRFTQLVRRCLDLAADVADKTGRDRDELFEHVHAQERYAEQAHTARNQALYRECFDNLHKYAGYLTQLLEDALPRPSHRPTRPPEEEAREAVEQFRGFLSTIWKKVRAKGRSDLEARLTDLAGQARGLAQRSKTEPQAVLRDVHRLGVEVEKVGDQLERGPGAGPDAGLLEGSG